MSTKAELEQLIAKLEQQIAYEISTKKEIAEAILEGGVPDYDEGLRQFVEEHMGEEYIPALPVTFFFGWVQNNESEYGDYGPPDDVLVDALSVYASWNIYKVPTAEYTVPTTPYDLAGNGLRALVDSGSFITYERI